jgi:uncharacterized protein (DUF2235 family)
MRGRLVVCFDGTWNTAEDQTNVSRLYAAIADRDVGCRGQLKFYDEGVGTKFGDRVRGGTLGRGLDVNILQGYCWVVNNYHQKGETWKEESRYGEDPVEGPDELFLFGFSRGAFTARSLGGMINRCGILRKDLFRERAGRRLVTPDDPIVQEAWTLYRAKIEAPPYANATTRDAPECVDFRRKYSCPDDGLAIKFLGVWDTVGALGIPRSVDKLGLDRGKYEFHDTGLGKVVENAFHAVAIDENREEYDVTLWTSKYPHQTVEQRWFPGAHSNVGGGYEDDTLPDGPLTWVAEEATKRGLLFVTTGMPADAEGPRCKAALPEEFKLRGDEFLSPVRDSFSEMGYGAYKVAKLFRRFYRPMQLKGVNETIDESARKKWSSDPRYRPYNLAHAGRADLQDETVYSRTGMFQVPQV